MGTARRTLPEASPAQAITQANYAEVLRSYHTLALGSTERSRLRLRLIAFMRAEGRATIEAEDYDGVVAYVQKLSDLYMPEEFARGQISEAFRAPARYLARKGAHLGKEAHVLAAHTLLQKLGDREEDHATEYERVADWGRAARATIEDPIERFSRLIEVWEEHAILTPDPPVLAELARLHVARRDAIAKLLEQRRKGSEVGVSFRQLQLAPLLMRRAPLDVAGVYLTYGDIAAAIARVEAMGSVSGIELRLLRLLYDVRSGGEDGSDAVLGIAGEFRQIKPAASRGLCRHGLRHWRGDARFAVCLARLAADEQDYPTATAWYAEAIRIAPEERRVYDEAIEKLNELIERGLFDPDPAAARGIARTAQRILRERIERWPQSQPSVAPERLHFLVGMLEMNAGNPEAARASFEASLNASKNPDALIQLGILAERTGRPDEALARYRAAMKQIPDDAPPGVRAEILQHLGDAARYAGDATEASGYYRKALAQWDEALETVEGPATSIAHVHRGVLYARLGEPDRSSQAFQSAMAAGPGFQEIYARILSLLVVVNPNPQLAYDVFRRAQRQLTLEPEWKVYFGLWVALIAGRAGESVPDDFRELLGDLSAGGTWWGKLARFGAGQMTYRELLEAASDLGQRTEAHFYEGARLLSADRLDEARRLFERVLDTKMVNFYEFQMAQEFLNSWKPRGLE